ncbi:MAG: hypothetical protein AAF787_19965 [Chloroflexota bacterium]
MLLSDYEWSRNPRGMHNANVFEPIDLDIYRTTGMGWVKLVTVGNDFYNLIPQFFEMNVTPVVRIYLGQFGNRPMLDAHRSNYQAFAALGVKWFEFYNEPNLEVEWPGNLPDWNNPAQLEPLMDNWLAWAEFIINDLGGYPGFIPLAESASESRNSAVRWMDAMLNYLADRHFERFLNVLRGGCYCATHPYILNHFYQQQPGGGPLSLRAPSEQRAREGGWHFEYPYDPYTQANDPGRTVYGGTDRTPFGDPNGLIAMGRMFNERCATIFGTQAIPVLGTEGGIWNFPAPGEPAYQQDTRFPPYTNASQAEATVAMFDWCAQVAPPWFFGVCLWKEDDYVNKGQRALTRLIQNAPIQAVIPDIPVMQDGSSYVPGLRSPGAAPEVLKGPGPIHGQVDFHMVIVDDTLSMDWWFQTAGEYWDQFRPILTTETDFLDMMPWEKSLGITLIVSNVRRFEAETLIREGYPNAYLDPIIVTPGESTLEQVSRVFAQRLETGRRFG